MRNDDKKTLLVAIMIVIVLAVGAGWGYVVITHLSPAIKDGFETVKSNIDEKLGRNQEELVVEVPDPEVDKEEIDPEDEQEVVPEEEEKSEDEEEKESDGGMVKVPTSYTYKDQNTRTYAGPVIYQVERYLYNTNGKILTDFRDGDTHKLDLKKNVDGSEAVLEYDGKCFYIDADLNITEIANNISTCGINYEGGFIYYVEEDEQQNTKLYIYEVATGERTLISEDHAIFVTMSPDGRTVAYFNYRTTKELRIGGLDREEVINKVDYSVVPITVSNDGETVYYYSFDDEKGLFCMNDGVETQISDESYADSYFDRECKQILFFTKLDVMYYKAGDEMVSRVWDQKVDHAEILGLSYQQPDAYSDRYIVDTDSFSDAITMWQDSSCYALAGDVPAAVCLNPGSDWASGFITCMTAEGPACYYQTHDSVMKAVYDGERTAQTILVTNDDYSYLSDFVCNRDFTGIWYLESNKVYYLQEGQEPVMVADQGSRTYYEIKWNPYNDKCYYIKDGHYLYCVGDNEDSSKLITDDCDMLDYMPADIPMVAFIDADKNHFVVINDEVMAY